MPRGPCNPLIAGTFLQVGVLTRLAGDFSTRCLTRIRSCPYDGNGISLQAAGRGFLRRDRRWQGGGPERSVCTDAGGRGTGGSQGARGVRWGLGDCGGIGRDRGIEDTES